MKVDWFLVALIETIVIAAIFLWALVEPVFNVKETDVGRIVDFQLGDSCAITTDYGIKYYVSRCFDLDTTKHLIKIEGYSLLEKIIRYRFE